MSDTPQIPLEHSFLTVHEAAKQLGYSHMTIRRRIDAGQFPAIKIGSKAMVPRAFVKAFMAAAYAGRTVTVEQFASEWSAHAAAGEAS